MIDRLKVLFSGNLRRRLIFSVAGIHAVMMSLFIWDLTVRQQEMVLDQQASLATALAQSVATSAAIWVQARDLAGLQEITEAQKRYPELAFAMVTDNHGKILAHTMRERRGQVLRDLPGTAELHVIARGNQLVDVAAPALVAGQQVGWVRIGVGQSTAHTALARITRDGLLYALAAILVGGILAALLARHMTRRLDIIQSTADAVQAGQSSQRARLEGEDEAGVLARQFNRMLDSLQERERELHQIQATLNLTRDGIFMFDPDSLRFFYVNEGAIEQVGYSREELMGMTAVDIKPDYDKPAFRAMVAPLMRQDNSTQVFETRHQHKDGHAIPVEITLQYLAPGGEPPRFVAMVRDITERKRNEEELARHRENLEMLVETRTTDLATKNRLFEAISRMQGQFIRETDPHRLFSLIIQEFTALTGSEMGFVGDIQRDASGQPYLRDYSFHNIPTDTASQHFYERHKASGFMFRMDRGNNLFNRVIARREAVIANDPAHDAGHAGLPEGHPPLKSFLGIPVWYGDNLVGEIGLANRPGGYDQQILDMLQPVVEACGRIIVARWDRAAREEAETALVKAKEAAEDANQVKSMFLANMSHELRTPLNAILGMLYLALRNDLPGTLRNQLSKARISAHSLLSIINDLLDLSKIEAGKLEIEQIEFGLDGVLDRVTDVIAPQATEKNIEFLIRYDNAIPCTLVGDPLRLGQVLINLCNNAVKFTEQGQVEVSFHADACEENNLTVRICVQDSGIGMNQELQARLFQKFTQADASTTRRFGGSGLGLAICKNLVEMMGGKLWIEHSAPGQGSILCLSLPLGIAPQARQVHRDDIAKKAGPLLKGMRALVIDDNAVSREILSEMLRDFHMEVDGESSGAAALARMENAGERPYDLALVDWRMPGMNGDELIRKLRRNPAIPQAKLIMITAYGREDVLSDAEEAGSDGFLVKPVSPSALLDGILNALGRERLLDSEKAPASLLPRARILHDFSGLRLLLVEDNEINREFAGALLRGEDIEVDEAHDGKEAVAKVQEREYDCVLMDIQMPVMDGLEATRQIRALGETPGNERYARLPIIAMTALAMSADIQSTRDAGMNDHVVKPVEPEHLMATLAKWVTVAERAKTVPYAASPAVPDDMQALSSLDVQSGIHRIGGQVRSYRKQLHRFAEHYANAAGKLQTLLNEPTTQPAEEFCHALKGVTGNIGARTLHAKTTEIDDLLKQGKWPSVEAIQEMAALLQAVLDDIGTLDATDPATSAAAASPLDHAELRTLMQQLTHALEHDLGAVEPLLDRLRASLAGGEWQSTLDGIARQIDAFDIGAASAAIQQLQTDIDSARS